MMNFDANSGFWVVAGSTTEVFSAMAGAFVPIGDASYVEWLALGNLPSSQTNNASLLLQLQLQAPNVSLWNLYSVAEAQSAQSLIIEAAAANAIVNGISSSALGVAHAYPSGLVDQMNLTALVLRSTLPGFSSAMAKTLDAGWLSHTAAQIQQVGVDVEAFISAQLQHSATRQAAIMAATTIPAIQAINW